MKKLFMLCAMLTLSACETVPDSVKVVLEKEREAIRAVESDYRTSINMYHSELIKQIDARLNDIFRYEVEKIEALNKTLTSAEVMKLDRNRAEQRTLLIAQAEEAKQKYLNNKNLEILLTLQAKVMQYASADKFTASDFATILTELDVEINKIKEHKQKQGSENTPKTNEGVAK